MYLAMVMLVELYRDNGRKLGFFVTPLLADTYSLLFGVVLEFSAVLGL